MPGGLTIDQWCEYQLRFLLSLLLLLNLRRLVRYVWMPTINMKKARMTPRMPKTRVGIGMLTGKGWLFIGAMVDRLPLCKSSVMYEPRRVRWNAGGILTIFGNEMLWGKIRTAGVLWQLRMMKIQQLTNPRVIPLRRSLGWKLGIICFEWRRSGR
jgi:hypothetical protein